MGRGVRRGEEKGRGEMGGGNKKKERQNIRLLDLAGQHSRKQSVIQNIKE